MGTAFGGSWTFPMRSFPSTRPFSGLPTRGLQPHLPQVPLLALTMLVRCYPLAKDHHPLPSSRESWEFCGRHTPVQSHLTHYRPVLASSPRRDLGTLEVGEGTST